MNKLGWVLRILVSPALLIWLFAKMDYSALGENLANAELRWLLLPHLLTPVTFLCCLWRWQILHRARGLHISNRDALRYMFIGHFISNFFPSNVGGDVARATLVTRQTGTARWSTAAGTVVVDRVTGLLGLFVVLPCAVALHFDWIRGLGLLLPLGAACAGIVVLTVFIFSDWGAGLLSWMGRWRLTRKPIAVIRDLHDAMLAFRKTPRAVAGAVAVSALFYVVSGLQVYCLLLAFPDVTVPWTTQIVTFGAVSLLAMLPISFNGYGLQEGGYALLFVSLGFTNNQAVAAAVANRLLSLAISVVGGLIFMASSLRAAEFKHGSSAEAA